MIFNLLLGEKISRKRFKLGKGGACPSKYYSTVHILWNSYFKFINIKLINTLY